MASNSKPTIIIVGGAFHTPESYGTLTYTLEAAGFEVHVPRLPSCNEARPPNADLTSDTALVRSYVESLVRAGHTVMAVGHSYGGQVCSNALHGLGTEARAAQGLKGGVAHLVYMAGYALQEGRSTVDKFKEYGNIDSMGLVFDVAEDQTVVPHDPRLLFGLSGPGIDEVEIEAYIKSLCRWHGKGMFQALERTAWREIPVTYIHATTDISISPPAQQSMVDELRNAGCEVQTFTIESGHCPNFTAVQGVVDVLNKVASN